MDCFRSLVLSRVFKGGLGAPREAAGSSVKTLRIVVLQSFCERSLQFSIKQVETFRDDVYKCLTYFSIHQKEYCHSRKKIIANIIGEI